jgi:hypothetical protein
MGFLNRLLWYSNSHISIYDLDNARTGACECCGISPNRLVVGYMNWTFRNSFGTVLMSAILWFFTWTLIFALLIWAALESEPTCVNGTEYHSDFFHDAFALSWTTFATVVRTYITLSRMV